MKKINAFFASMLITSTVMAGVLDDSTYCRTVKSTAQFGQPAVRIFF